MVAKLISLPTLPYQDQRGYNSAVLWLGQQCHHLHESELNFWLSWHLDKKPYALTCLQSHPNCVTLLGFGPTLSSAVACEGLGHLSCFSTLKNDVLIAFPSGSGPLYCPGKVQGPLSQVLQSVR